MSEVEQLVTLTIDGYQVSVPKGTMVIRAAEQLGIEIPRFCDHPLLDPVGACRQCLVEVGMPARITDEDGTERTEIRWMRAPGGAIKPQASCTIAASAGMQVRTHLSSDVAAKAQQGIMELLLMNHPLDCPICDKGGECPLQNQAMSTGRPEARFDGAKRTYPKPIPISAQVLLDRERCVLCARCTRFADQIAGDPFIELIERGADQQVGIGGEETFDSYFSGNTIQICPVGALTSADYRFRARPFDLVSTPSACEHCASGCALRTDHRRNVVTRRLAGDDPEVNQEWSCDKGRFAFRYADEARLTHPLVRRDGELVPVSWPEALRTAAEGLMAAEAAGVISGGRVTVEDAYAYSKFARIAAGTNSVDFRVRQHNLEETAFLGSTVASTQGPTYADLDKAPAVLLVAFEPEEESPIVFLRLRRAVRKNGTQVAALAVYLSRGNAKLDAHLLPTVPGTEPRVLDNLDDHWFSALQQPGAVVLVGERAATSRGTLTAVLDLVERTGAALAWIPRRAGERGALDVGAFPALLPGGRPVEDPAARVDMAAAWEVDTLPEQRGLDTYAMLAAAADGEIGALVLGGVEPADLPEPTLMTDAAARAFTISLEMRPSALHEHADVVFPVAAVAEKAGTFVDWEGRSRSFEAALTSNQRPDAWVLEAIAAEMDIDLGVSDVDSVRHELAELGPWDGERLSPPDETADAEPAGEPGLAVLATWRQLLDEGLLAQALPPDSQRPAVARISAGTADEVGVTEGHEVTLSGPEGSITLPCTITDMPDGVVWVPLNSAGSRVYVDLGLTAGAQVSLAAGGAR